MNFGNFNDMPWYFNIFNERVTQCCCDPNHECWTPPVEPGQTIQLFPCIHCGTHTPNRYLGQPCCESCAGNS